MLIDCFQSPSSFFYLHNYHYFDIHIFVHKLPHNNKIHCLFLFLGIINLQFPDISGYFLKLTFNVNDLFVDNTKWSNVIFLAWNCPFLFCLIFDKSMGISIDTLCNFLPRLPNFLSLSSRIIFAVNRWSNICCSISLRSSSSLINILVSGEVPKHDSSDQYEWSPIPMIRWILLMVCWSQYLQKRGEIEKVVKVETSNNNNCNPCYFITEMIES